MLRRIIRSIFATSRRHEVGAGRFNHCSSVCPFRGGVLLAWYSGTGECRDDQSVYVTFSKDDGTYSEAVRIGDKTGNPVIWSHGTQAYLIWSKFEDTGDVRRIVDRWRFCSLWIQEVVLNNGIEFVAEPRQLAFPDQHLLGRCNPIHYGTIGCRTDYLLPLYDELARSGVIYKIRIVDKSTTRVLDQTMHTMRVGSIGQDMIQPTLWKTDNRVHSLSRNFGTNETACRYCYSDDFGESWSSPRPTKIPNRNSSLHAIQWAGRDLLLWNDTDKISRRNLTLGEIAFKDRVPSVQKICVIGDVGGYPSMCVDEYDNLHMTFSNEQRKIEHRVWNRRQLDKVISS